MLSNFLMFAKNFNSDFMILVFLILLFFLFFNLLLSDITIGCHTDTPYRQDSNLGEDKAGLLGPKKDKYKVCSFFISKNFGLQLAGQPILQGS